MKINKQIELLLEHFKEQSNSLQFGNIDFIIHNSNVIRVDIRNSIKPDEKLIHVTRNKKGIQLNE